MNFCRNGTATILLRIWLSRLRPFHQYPDNVHRIKLEIILRKGVTTQARQRTETSIRPVQTSIKPRESQPNSESSNKHQMNKNPEQQGTAQSEHTIAPPINKTSKTGKEKGWGGCSADHLATQNNNQNRQTYHKGTDVQPKLEPKTKTTFPR